MLILENFYGAIFTENLQAIASVDDLIISLFRLMKSVIVRYRPEICFVIYSDFWQLERVIYSQLYRIS